MMLRALNLSHEWYDTEEDAQAERDRLESLPSKPVVQPSDPPEEEGERFWVANGLALRLGERSGGNKRRSRFVLHLRGFQVGMD